MKAILINPFWREIKEVEYDGNFQSIYKLTDCETFTAVTIENDDAIFIDDEGLLKGDQQFFVYKGYPQPLAGIGLILGTDEEGNSITPKITLEEAAEKITFIATSQLPQYF